MLKSTAYSESINRNNLIADNQQIFRSIIVKFKLLSLALAGSFVLAVLALAPTAALAQEGELQVVDEVIAQINEDVITLSMLKRESKERIEALKQGGMTEQQAAEEVSKRQAELIATLINEALLLQKGKELEMAADVEAEVNRRMLEIAKEQGITTIEKLDAAMRESGVDPVATRQTMRVELMKQSVIQQEVDRKIFFGLTIEELKKYFQAHPDKFKKPESVTLSEIYLSSAGKNEAEVKARALELIRQSRAGTDFAALATANSEREVDGVRIAPQTKGKVGTFEVPSLRPDIGTLIKGVPQSGVSEPLRTNDGYQILRVDERTAGTTTPTFNENKVREVITMERTDKEREAYLQSLRDDSYIKISDNYRAAVAPILKLKPEKTSDNTTTTSEKKDKKKG